MPKQILQTQPEHEATKTETHCHESTCLPEVEKTPNGGASFPRARLLDQGLGARRPQGVMLDLAALRCTDVLDVIKV